MQSGTFQILVGIDFSDTSAVAMYHVIGLAERLNAVLHLCHITPPASGLASSADLGLSLPAEFKQALEARLRLERMRAMIGAGVKVEVHLRMGETVRSLLDLASELHADMLVVGSHGYGAVFRLLLGSVSAQLARLSPVPVLIVPAPGRAEAAVTVSVPIVEPGLPSVGSGPNETLDISRTNDCSSGSVNLSPMGVGGYDVNPELRVRY